MELVRQMNRANFARYVAVGLVAYVCEMATLYLFKNVLDWSAVTSVAISFWVGLSFAFVLQKFIAFQNHDKRPHVLARQLAGYAALVVWNYCFTLLAVRLFQATTSVFVIRSAVIAIVTSWNYAAYRVLFKKAVA